MSILWKTNVDQPNLAFNLIDKLLKFKIQIRLKTYLTIGILAFSRVRMMGKNDSRSGGRKLNPNNASIIRLNSSTVFGQSSMKLIPSPKELH